MPAVFSTQKVLDKYFYFFISSFCKCSCLLPLGPALDEGWEYWEALQVNVWEKFCSGSSGEATCSQEAVGRGSRELSPSSNSATNVLCGLVQLPPISGPWGCILCSEGGGKTWRMFKFPLGPELRDSES